MRPYIWEDVGAAGTGLSSLGGSYGEATAVQAAQQQQRPHLCSLIRGGKHLQHQPWSHRLRSPLQTHGVSEFWFDFCIIPYGLSCAEVQQCHAHLAQAASDACLAGAQRGGLTL